MMTQVTAHVLDLIKKNLMIQNEKGFRKYNETLDDVPFENYDWNQMAMEEMSDAMHYLMMENMKLKHELEGKFGMLLQEYQTMCERTMPNTDETGTYSREQILIMALGVGGEAGELQEVVKKWVGHGHDFDRDKVVKEAGDLMFYIAALCKMLDITLDEVCTMNIHKLNNRYPNGFSKEASINRRDEK
ncbi:hypothetical protein Bfsp1_7 [Cytobacillus phage Bfsp1]|nr:hypothetical protein Bfsp1_7 [Cytobacillus phage Bfsp1]